MNYEPTLIHPRAESLRIRKRLADHFRTGVVAEAGLIAHGRGEAFDYLLGEKTTANASRAIEAAAAALLLAKHPVISVNGNTAALVAEDTVHLAEMVGARIEVNLFYGSTDRESAIKRLLETVGAEQVLGVGGAATATIPEMQSERRHVDPLGIAAADVVLVPLEDGDRTEALVKAGKRVIAVDLNPISRTSQGVMITIVDNLVRTMPALVKATRRLKAAAPEELRNRGSDFDNDKNLSEAMTLIRQRLLLLTNEATSRSNSLPDYYSARESNVQRKIDELRSRKDGQKIIMLTAYDFQMARILDETGIDMILVGDSLGMVFQGNKDTKSVTMEQMLYHTKAVARGAKNTPIIVDMPINSHRTKEDALENAKSFLDTGAHGVKIEGKITDVINALLDHKIPVMGHVGLMPQTAERYRVQGRDVREEKEIFKEAVALDNLGVFSIVLECIPEKLAKRITHSVSAPTIGIGAGKYCDGQVLVTADILGLTPITMPKYVKKYANLNDSITNTVSQLRREVELGLYPDNDHTYH